ncbi:hypothetical protein HED55_06320 [Ochrobactrum haematophilum]|uniref:Uncharacterized protein n=1 Tax=Brucella haematophila TaxID=419474 RepID=A0ABX1DK13_9HYPH|nr:hypothetical protein [Brucella haematophila]
MNNHFNRTARLGASVLINERWYKMVNIHYNLRFDHFEIQAGGFFLYSVKLFQSSARGEGLLRIKMLALLAERACNKQTTLASRS